MYYVAHRVAMRSQVITKCQVLRRGLTPLTALEFALIHARAVLIVLLFKRPATPVSPPTVRERGLVQFQILFWDSD